MRVKLLPLDVKFSEFIRKRALVRVRGCERCLTPKTDYKQLQCSHFFGRAKKSVRWDEDNAAGLCFGCHQHFTSHPYDHADWFQKRLGDKFDLLVCRAYKTHPKPDQEAIWLYLEEQIKEVESGDKV